MKRLWLRKIGAILLVLALCLSAQSWPVSAQQITGFDAANVERATVSVMQVYLTSLGQTVISCVGSGTLVSADGLILTNAHIAIPSSHCKSDRIVIGLNIRLDQPPVPTYYAQVVESNVGWDLAVLQITTTLDGRAVDRSTLSLPFAELGDSEATKLDDTVNVVGYTTVGNGANGASQVVRGTISGFMEEAQISNRIASRANNDSGAAAWIKFSAAIPGSMSGGGAYTVDGKLVGIPTIEPASSGGASAVCRRIQDSNGDGIIDDRDTCIPVGGFINALRPSRLAQGLILAAELGISPSIRPAKTLPTPSGNPTFSRLFIAPGVNAAGMPISAVTSLPSGTKSLYLFFDYDNMVDGMIYELSTRLDGVPNPTFSLAPATWSGGQRGLWYIGSSAQTWPNGTYDFTLSIEGNRVASTTITIGGPARQDPSFSDILFGVLTDTKQLINAGDVLPMSDTMNAVFVYNNIPTAQPWCQVWYYEGLKITSNSAQWSEGTNGKYSISAGGSQQTLKPGRYRLELYLSACDDPNPKLAATSDFIMAGAQTALQTNIFDKLNFATDLKDDQPSGTLGTTFANTISTLYATFDWRSLNAGTPWTWRWSVDDHPLFEVTQPWTDDPDGTSYWLRLASTGRLPDGSYKLELLAADIVMASATAKVGLGQLPPSVFGVAEGVQIQGTVTDAETGQGIPGVTFIVLKSNFGVRDFTWQMSQIFDLSYSDSGGRFALSKLLPRNDSYSVIVMATGYLPVQTDGLSIDDKTKSPLNLNIQLNRD